MNPIVRMMKRYINMPLKYALPLLFICALVLSATTGCTTSTTNQTTVQIPTVNSDKSSYITSQFSDAGYAIVTPFNKSTNNYGNVMYTGVVKDTPEKKLNPYSHKITIELTKNNSTTKTRYAQYKTQLSTAGLIKVYDYGDYIYFSETGNYANATRLVWLDMNEPSTLNSIYNTGVYLNLGDTFMVTLDDSTKL
jgi:hypothetical protein